MIIKRLRFKNLNSLAGEWEIDFTQPEYVSEGIFLIAGQTGVGKTTILDAICLALYGQTPRLGKITKSENEIIRRQTAECFAEILFETPDGAYICHWSQRRARGKTDGALQAPKHEVAHADTGKPIEDMLSKTAKAVADICGLDFDRFTRSIMLAQGDFAKFLDATAGDRSDILENITGSKIYSDLSIEVHKKKTTEDAKLKEIVDQMAGIQIFSEEQVNELKIQFKESQSLFTAKKKDLEALQIAQNWIQSLQKEKALIEQTTLEVNEHALLIEKSKPDQLALKNAHRAREVQPHFRDWERSDQEQTQLEKSQQETAELSTKQNQLYQQHLELSEKAKSAYLKQREESRSLEPKLLEAGKISARVEEETLTANTQREAYKGIQSQAKASRRTIDETTQKLVKIEAEHQTSQQYLDMNPSHAMLVSELSGMWQLGESWKSSLKLLERITAENKSAEKSIKLQTDQLTQDSEALVKERSLLEKSEQSIVTNRKSYKEQLDDKTEQELVGKLSDLRAKRILDLEHLEQFRETLSDDHPCPVCGSLEHPYSEQTPPSQDETKLAIQSLEKRLASISELSKSFTELNLDKERQLSLVNQRESKIKALKQQLSEKQDALKKELAGGQATEKQSQDYQEQLSLKIGNFTKQEVHIDSIDSLFMELSEQSKSWKIHSEASGQFKENKATLTTTREAEKKALSDLQARMQEIEENGKKSVAKLNTYTESLKLLIGESSIEELKSAHEAKLKLSEDAAEKQNKLREEHKAKVNSLKTQQVDITKRLTQLESLLKEQLGKFKAALESNNFATNEDFLSARMESEAQNLLEQKITQLKQREQQLQTRLTDARQRLETESTKQLTKLTSEEISESIKLISTEYDSLSAKFGALQQQLTDHEKALSTLDEKLLARTKQETECLRWNRLHGLIGSSDGKKFRNFAQGLTFEIMVRHANDQLTKMTDRYQLIRDLKEPLDLSVIDSYQAGEIRSTKNLSGGESFIISLSLALGLSKMASKNVQVDSLFLDEGFGTLDEEALETAIDTLASMNQEGKIIGIISHIAALKDRITSQIKLERSSHGSATISGPGIRQVLGGDNKSYSTRKEPAARQKSWVD